MVPIQAECIFAFAFSYLEWATSDSLYKYEI